MFLAGLFLYENMFRKYVRFGVVYINILLYNNNKYNSFLFFSFMSKQIQYFQGFLIAKVTKNVREVTQNVRKVTKNVREVTQNVRKVTKNVVHFSEFGHF